MLGINKMYGFIGNKEFAFPRYGTGRLHFPDFLISVPAIMTLVVHWEVFVIMIPWMHIRLLFLFFLIV